MSSCACSKCEAGGYQRQVVAGWVLREDHRLRWNQGVSDPSLRLCMCGEIGHVRWLLYIAAAREAAARDLDTLLAEFAQKVGIEYDSKQRRRKAPHNETATLDTGGNP